MILDLKFARKDFEIQNQWADFIFSFFSSSKKAAGISMTQSTDPAEEEEDDCEAETFFEFQNEGFRCCGELHPQNTNTVVKLKFKFGWICLFADQDGEESEGLGEESEEIPDADTQEE